MNDIVDYAMPLMKMENLLRMIHDLCLDKKYKEAGIEIWNIEHQAAQLRKNLIAMDLESK